MEADKKGGSMWYVKVNNETLVTYEHKSKAKDVANEVAREMWPNPEPASITVEDYRGIVHRSIYYDGWNITTDTSVER